MQRNYNNYVLKFTVTFDLLCHLLTLGIFRLILLTQRSQFQFIFIFVLAIFTMNFLSSKKSRNIYCEISYITAITGGKLNFGTPFITFLLFFPLHNMQNNRKITPHMHRYKLSCVLSNCVMQFVYTTNVQGSKYTNYIIC